MENFYIILVVILFALAISDLIVGVSNDAVNFLNSAIGSKAAPKWVIFLMASAGVLIGATFSNGMMEVARKGIFHPDMFYFSEIMIIFLAVMITDIILLDMFNTFGMPTSTTVSIVFELLGAAVTVSVVKIKTAGESVVLEISKYINSDKALAIITGILVSVVIAFAVGAVIQYIARLIFSFNYQKSMKYFGSVFGGLSITAITYFMLIKGIHGSTFAEIKISSDETLETWFTQNTGLILIFGFGFWVVFIQLLKWIFNIDILKLIVLVGTFALAMAFAGNDLVNFIGVPIAGFNSFEAWESGGRIDPGSFSMEMLRGQVDTPTYLLLIAGFVMILTLILSKKARSVVATSVDLSRQSEGAERFNSSLGARVLVRSVSQFSSKFQRTIPSVLLRKMNSQFVPLSIELPRDPDQPAFDKIRASVNLVVASILIALGTSLKLPLSTTYVTFMVAMGTSLADGAWDRESAVYRISGVFSVIGGWFLTAFIAFLVSGIIALLIFLGGKIMIFVFIAAAIFMVIRTQLFFKSRNSKMLAAADDGIDESDGTDKVVAKSGKLVVNTILSANKIFSVSLSSFIKDDRNALKEQLKSKNELNQKSKKLKDKVLKTLSKIENHIDSGHHYVQVIDYQREVTHTLNFIIQPLYEHINNNHKPFIDDQNEEIKILICDFDAFCNYAVRIIKENKFEELDELIRKRDEIIAYLSKSEKAQIRRIKGNKINTRNSVLYFNTLSETKNMLLQTINLIKSHRDFVTNSEKGI